MVNFDGFNSFVDLIINFSLIVFDRFDVLKLFMNEIQVAVLRISSMRVIKWCWPFQDVVGNGAQIYVYMKSKTLEA